MISAVLHASLMPLLSYIWMARPVATNNIKVQVRVGFRVLAMPFICTSCAAPVTRCKILLYILLQKKIISWKAYCPLIALYIFSLFNILDGWYEVQILLWTLLRTVFVLSGATEYTQSGPVQWLPAFYQHGGLFLWTEKWCSNAAGFLLWISAAAADSNKPAVLLL